MVRGGMSNRPGLPLAERSVVGAAGRPLGEADAAPAGDDQLQARPQQHHCWVDRPVTGSGPCPGLVIEWQRRAGRWCARVIYVASDNGATTVETWIDANHLHPAR